MSISNLGIGADAASLKNSATVSSSTLGGLGVTPILESGPASALSSVKNEITGGLDSINKQFTSIFGTQDKPLPNILSQYATYNYLIGLSVLTVEQINNPDKTYMAGQPTAIICKSASIDPNNRVSTAYGKFEYFINNLVIESVIGFERTKNTNATNISFDIYEPYSMGMFFLSLQTAALQAGHENWMDAIYLLTLEFRGNTEQGLMVNIPDASRYIPIKLSTSTIKVNESGTRYSIKGFSPGSVGQTVQYGHAKGDVSVQGKTVQEVLQTGEKSLQAVINERLKQLKDDKLVEKPDEILIYFPKQSASADSQKSKNNTESKDTATKSPSSGGNQSSITSELGVTRNESGALVQSTSECNELGSSKLGFDTSRRADPPMNKEDAVYKNGVWDRSNVKFDIKENNFKFSQDTSIVDAINQVLLMSDYPRTALAIGNHDGNGMRTWWRIETQVYYLDSKENLPKTGVFPKLIVFRVIPYKAHTSAITSPNVKAPGTDPLVTSVVKKYDYIYTGKNSEVLTFDIDYSTNFAMAFLADAGKRSQDPRTINEKGHDATFDLPQFWASLLDTLNTGNKPSKDPGVAPTTVKHSNTQSELDKHGGGGNENLVTRAAKQFHEAITNPYDMVNINMKIMGDPYWIAQSGIGNYTSKPVRKNLNSDGTVAYQDSEVDTVVNFRTPIDINQATGMYNFGGTSSTAPVVQISGAYTIKRVTSEFRDGQFTQTLMGYRRPQQENKTQGTNEQVLHVGSQPQIDS